MEFLKLKHFQITRKEGSDTVSAFTKKSIDLFALNIWVVIVVFKSCWEIRQRSWQNEIFDFSLVSIESFSKDEDLLKC